MSRSPLPAAELLFVDWHGAFLDAVRAEFAAEIAAGSVRAHCGDVGALLEPGRRRRMAFVSPSNSLLFFDGGYDDALRRMFPGLQRRCQARLREVGPLTALGRRYLPVGSALVARTSPDTVVVAAPTMFLPHDVSGTRNAYHALMAALMALDGFREGTGAAAFDALVVPAMCCGYGKMPHGESARQMHDALRDFLAGRRPPRVGGGGGAGDDDPELFMGPLRDDEQPDNFDNREIKVIDVADIRHVGTGRA
jgi:O-acetyl-ADP-ribose deacetylase (regulator of RNase III)